MTYAECVYSARTAQSSPNWDSISNRCSSKWYAAFCGMRRARKNSGSLRMMWPRWGKLTDRL